MPLRLLYYVSGHGFGHARRSMLVVRELLARRPDAEVTVRTSAAPQLFAPLPGWRVERSEIGAGMAEDGPLAIDPPGTLGRLVKLVADADQLVAAEVEAVRRIRPDVMLADVPFLAGEVAAAAGVPCFAVSNFTWDWICDPLLSEEPTYAAVRERMRTGYGKMTAAMRLPFGGVTDAFAKVIPTPLIAGRSERDPADALRAIGVSPADGRPRVLVGLRGGLPDGVLRAAAGDAPDYLFLMPPGGVLLNPPENVVVPRDDTVTFPDLVAASDIVVSKLGYGIVSDCIAAGKRLLWPRRAGFREDAVVEREAPSYMAMLELSAEPWKTGGWRASLDAIRSLPAPSNTMPTDGARLVADHVLRVANDA